MKNTKIVEGVFLETVFIIVDVAVLIYGTLERSNREYNNINTTLKQSKTTFLVVMKVGEKLKNIFLEAAMNYNKMSNSEKAKANDKIRENVKEIMKPRPKTEREKELDRLAKEEKEEYKRNKNAFYADPIHWNNNKRRRHGLSALRGSVNKYRSKKYPAFYPSVKFFNRLDDIITEKLEDNFKNNEYFNSFVEVKDLAVGDTNVFRVGE